MSKYQVLPLFSTPLMTVDIGPLDPMTLAWVKGLRYEKNAVAQTGSDDHLELQERGFTILDAPQLKKLRKKIKEAVDYYVYDLLDVDNAVDFYFTTSWINRLEYDENIELHRHSNALISGVYYIDVNPNSSPITFKKNRQHQNTFPQAVQPITKGLNWNQFNTDSYTVQPQTGNLIVFPSHLEHEVSYSNDKAYRYGLAFNLFAKGRIGKHSGKVDI